MVFARQKGGGSRMDRLTKSGEGKNGGVKKFPDYVDVKKKGRKCGHLTRKGSAPSSRAKEKRVKVKNTRALPCSEDILRTLKWSPAVGRFWSASRK